MQQDENLQRIEAWQQLMLDEYGWYAHFVRGGDEYPCQTNYHTHGLKEKLGHPDLQICLNIPPEQAKGLFGALVKEIEAGKRFSPDQPYLRLLQGEYPIRFVQAQETGRKLLRVLLPDRHGQLLESPYDEQLTKLKDGYPLPPLDYTPADIEDIDDVISFVASLKVTYQLNFHPDTKMGDYRIAGTDEPAFKAGEAQLLDTVRARCFEVCGKDNNFYHLSRQVIAILDKQQPQQEALKAAGNSRRRRSHRR